MALNNLKSKSCLWILLSFYTMSTLSQEDNNIIEEGNKCTHFVKKWKIDTMSMFEKNVDEYQSDRPYCYLDVYDYRIDSGNQKSILRKVKCHNTEDSISFPDPDDENQNTGFFVTLQCIGRVPMQLAFSQIMTNFKISTVQEQRGKAYLLLIQLNPFQPQHVGNYRIFPVTNASNYQSLNMFIQKKSPPFLINYGQKITTTLITQDSKVIIPCPTYSFNVDVSLKKINENGTFTEVQAANYYPEKGFEIDQSEAIYGNYICETASNRNSDSVRIHVKDPDLTRAPKVHLHIRQKTIAFDSSNEITCTKYDGGEEATISHLIFVESKNFMEGMNTFNIIQTVKTFQALKFTTLKFITTPPYGNEQVFQCPKYINDCSTSSNGFPKSGIVQCMTSKGFHIVGEYFTDLQDKIYWVGEANSLFLHGKYDDTSDDSPQYLKVQVQHYEEDSDKSFSRDVKIITSVGLNGLNLLRGKSYTFTCLSLEYFFIQNVQWFMTTYEGTILELFGEEKPMQFQRRRWAYFSSMFTQINSTLIVAISCTAESWDKRLKFNASVDVTITEPSEPKILANDITFKVNDGSPLRCEADGNPEPKLTWWKEDYGNFSQIDSREFVKIEKSKSADVMSILYPMSLNTTDLLNEDKVVAVYICVATNEFGTDKKHYSVVRKAPIVAKISKSTYAITAASSTVAIMLLVACIYLIYKRSQLQEGLTKQEVKEFWEGKGQLDLEYEVITSDVIDKLSFDKTWEIPQDKFSVETDNLLGEGEYGVVMCGKVNNAKVAVKTTQPYAEKAYILALLTELKIMAYVGKHDHIVPLIGSYTKRLDKGIVYIFMEYCPLGSLISVLKKCRAKMGSVDDNSSYVEVQSNSIRYSTDTCAERTTENNVNSYIEDDTSCSNSLSLSPFKLLQYSYQVSCGMAHLEEKNILHGDLASRNILVYDCNTVKITDFGLSRKLYDYTNYVKKNQQPLPWRWMAIESLRDLNFSTKSDVWSYGITLWEIFSWGQVPYPGLSWTVDFTSQLDEGLRPLMPSICSAKLFELMTKCWEKHPQNRLSFKEVKMAMSEILTNDQSNYEGESSDLYSKITL